LVENYSLFRKTVNARENFGMFIDHQMQEETAKDNQFCRFQMLKFFFLYFSLGITKE